MAFRSSHKQQPVDFLSVAFSICVVIVIIGWIQSPDLWSLARLKSAVLNARIGCRVLVLRLYPALRST